MPCCIFSYSECIKKLSILLRALNLISYLALYKLHTTRYCIFCLLVELLLLSLPLQDSSVFVQYFVEIIRQDPGGLGAGWGEVEGLGGVRKTLNIIMLLIVECIRREKKDLCLCSKS